MPHAVPPNRWSGESDCVVGPFTDSRVTEYFATHVVNVGDYGVTAGDVFARGNGWYVRIDGYDASVRLALAPLRPAR